MVLALSDQRSCWCWGTMADLSAAYCLGLCRLCKFSLTTWPPGLSAPNKGQLWLRGAGVRLLFCRYPHVPARPPSWPELPPEERPSRGAIFPKRQDERQNNSTTCADIKHYRILTFRLFCSSAFWAFFFSFFLQIPAKRSSRMALCLGAVWGLIGDSRISSFHSVCRDMWDLTIKPFPCCQRAFKGHGGGGEAFHTIFAIIWDQM